MAELTHETEGFRSRIWLLPGFLERIPFVQPFMNRFFSAVRHIDKAIAQGRTVSVQHRDRPGRWYLTHRGEGGYHLHPEGAPYQSIQYSPSAFRQNFSGISVKSGPQRGLDLDRMAHDLLSLDLGGGDAAVTQAFTDLPEKERARVSAILSARVWHDEWGLHAQFRQGRLPNVAAVIGNYHLRLAEAAVHADYLSRTVGSRAVPQVFNTISQMSREEHRQFSAKLAEMVESRIENKAKLYQGKLPNVAAILNRNQASDMHTHARIASAASHTTGTEAAQRPGRVTPTHLSPVRRSAENGQRPPGPRR
ncbi:hypothetical protein ACIQB5_51385 [Streptomyces sp. NPDC088560]|uniref:hypothetical protein n=1 Tax=Streptomyces sp. NPDC088560 TaxID=3365868 RepID=UPI0037FD68E8